MGGSGNTAIERIASVRRDEGWYAERRTEILRSMANVEKNTLLTDIFGTAFIVGFPQLLPNARDFHLPGLLRIMAAS